MTLKLEYIKETKNKYVFSDTNSAKSIEGLYILKDVLLKEGYKVGDRIQLELTMQE